MPDHRLVRGARQHPEAGTPTPGTADTRDHPSPRRHRYKVGTWVRNLTAVILLDPNALTGAGTATPTATRTTTGNLPAPDRSGAPAAATTTAHDTARSTAFSTALDAAAALIVSGDTDAGFLLLALTSPDPSRPGHTWPGHR